MAGRKNQKLREERWRTAIVPVTLTGASYRQARQSAHALAGLWNIAVRWVRQQWEDGNHAADAYECKRFLSNVSRADKPFHAHSGQEVAFDLFEAIETSRTNRRAGMKCRAPWREKKYRPITFTREYGWRLCAATGKLRLSFGRETAPILLAVPAVTDPVTGNPVPPSSWGQIQLCWDIDARRWSLHIAVPTSSSPRLDTVRVTAIDEGIINPVTLAAFAYSSAPEAPIIDVTWSTVARFGPSNATETKPSGRSAANCRRAATDRDVTENSPWRVRNRKLAPPRGFTMLATRFPARPQISRSVTTPEPSPPGMSEVSNETPSANADHRHRTANSFHSGTAEPSKD